MREPRWVDRRAVLLLHDENLAEHGGNTGIRDEGLLDSALARPRHRFAYSADVDISHLAAAYGFGLAQNHPFVDGNKRAAFITTVLLLRLNGYRLETDRADEIRMMLGLAAGQVSEDEFAIWIRTHSRRSR
jgi:death-on-curing protein